MTIEQKKTTDMSGGNLIFKAGIGAKNSEGRRCPDGAFIFQMADGKEMMRFEPDGTVTVRGTKVDDDRKIYENFREWFLHASITLDTGVKL